MSAGWIGVDLDGTLAYDDGVWRGIEHIGEPVPAMVVRVKDWLAEDVEVRIFTARVSDLTTASYAAEIVRRWCVKVLGRPLEVTCRKDWRMLELWDDRAVGVVPNTGRVAGSDYAP
jgi:hypothetical protein